MTKRRPTPLGALGRGLLAAAIGTLAMDLLWYWRYKQCGVESGFVVWEFSVGLDDWDKASAPGKMGGDCTRAFASKHWTPDTRRSPTTSCTGAMARAGALCLALSSAQRLSAIVQVLIPPRVLHRYAGGSVSGIAAAAAFGVISSSCSCSSAAAARALYRRGVDARAPFSFLVSSTNMNIAILIMFWVLVTGLTKGSVTMLASCGIEARALRQLPNVIFAVRCASAHL